MRRAAAFVPLLALGACNLVTGVTDLVTGPADAGTPDVEVVDPTPLPPRDARAPEDTGTDVVLQPEAEAAPASSVTMTIGATPGSVNLTNEGSIDWIEWGEDNTVIPSRKTGGTDIDDFVITGTNTALFTEADNNFIPAETWNNGTPRATDNGNHQFAWAYVNNGDVNQHDLTLTFRAKSTPTPRNLALYVVAARVNSTIEASFGAGRAVAAPQVIDAPVGNAQFKRVLFTFSSEDSAKLEVKFTIAQRYEASQNARLGFPCATLFP